MSEFTKRRPKALAAVLLSSVAFVWLVLFIGLGPTTTTIRGSDRAVYFQCSGSRLWISGSRWSRQRDYQRHYVFETYQPNAFARIRADTLEVYSLGLKAPPSPDLVVPVRSVVLDGYYLGQLRDHASEEGLQFILC